MDGLIIDIMEMGGTFLLVVAIAAISIDQHILRTRKRLRIIYNEPLSIPSALEVASEFYSIKGLTARGVALIVAERSLILFALPVGVYLLAETLNPEVSIYSLTDMLRSDLGVATIFAIIAATFFSIWQTSTFIKLARDSKSLASSAFILLGDVFLSLKIGVFTLAAFVSCYLFLTAYFLKPPEDTKYGSAVVTTEASLFGNNVVAVSAYPTGHPVLTIQSTEKIPLSSVISLFLGHAEYEEVEVEPISLSEGEKYLGFDASYLDGATHYRRILQVRQSPPQA
ncbi:hypothetical protein C8N38_114106 [Rhodovulum kholense]|uniref:Uncharacterized protein n=2 Tax=Rhodovulum kholense TaxID=453584 RepID=A0A8E3APJ7_9RHOB|nr:hypothetical protein C8N38_114106 [Rhodovulum kholense]